MTDAPTKEQSNNDHELTASRCQVCARFAKGESGEYRVALTEFRGKKLVDFRWFTDFNKIGCLAATRKGVSLPVEQLPDLVDAVLAAEATARRHGLLPERRASA